MSKLLCKPSVDAESGRYQLVTPESAGWTYVGFEAYDLSQGKSLKLQDDDMEMCLVLLSGKADVLTGDLDLENIGQRMSVFEDVAPCSVYVPAGQTVSINATTGLELAVCKAPGKGGFPARLISQEDVTYECRGTGANMRHIYNILPENAAADSLLVVEVKTPSGSWSSYPPHRHDVDDLPKVSYLEETYYHRINPPQGFAFQRVYDDEGSIDETMAVHDKDLVMVPKGYHPYGVPHGYTGYYLNVMAGPTRIWQFYNQPEHEWIVNNPDL